MTRVLRNQPEGVAERTRMSPAGIDRVVDVFATMLEDGEHPGAQLAVYRDGELVIELVGGTHHDGTPLSPESLFPVYSTTKGLAAMVVHMLHDRGLFSYDDPVARYWPEFAQSGKERITIAEVMSHRAGLAAEAGGFVTWREWSKPNGIASLMEQVKPNREPGAGPSSYHAYSYGHILNELVRRWTGYNVGELLRTEICNPLGIEDVFVGLPEAAYSRLSKLGPVDSAEEIMGAEVAAATRRAIESGALELPAGGEMLLRGGGTNRPVLSSIFFNSYEILRLCLPFGNGVARARDLAHLMNVFAFEGTYNGRRFFARETFDRAVTPTNAGETDLGIPSARWGLGLMLGGSPGRMFGDSASVRACGHFGGYSSVAWADPDKRLAVAFLPNGLRSPSATLSRFKRIGDAIHAASPS